MFTPCFFSLEDYHRGWADMQHSVKSGFRSHYEDHLAAVETVVSCAKSYIVKNADRVTDWSGLRIRLKLPNGEKVYYYKHEPGPMPTGDDPISEALREFEEHCRDHEQPVMEITNIILDPSDGDLSITVNGTEYIAISDRAVIDLAAYIEKNS
jgi:hypothetical protein